MEPGPADPPCLWGGPPGTAPGGLSCFWGMEDEARDFVNLIVSFLSQIWRRVLCPLAG
jgi:hypothetical protein